MGTKILFRAIILLAIAFGSWFGGAILAGTNLPKSQARAASEFLNRVAGPLHDHTSDAREQIIVVAQDLAHVRRENQRRGLDRTWPLAYGALALDLEDIREVFLPEVLFLDFTIANVRGFGGCDGTKDQLCDTEGFAAFLETLCAMGGNACAGPPLAPRCKPGAATGPVTRVVLGHYGPTPMPTSLAEGPAQRASRAALEGFFGLVASCDHLGFADIAIDPHFSRSSDYKIRGPEGGGPGGRTLPSPASAILARHCQGAPASDTGFCAATSARLAMLGDAGVKIGLTWGSNRHHAPMLNQRVSCLNSTAAPILARNRSMQFVCPYPPMALMSEVKTLWALPAAELAGVVEERRGKIVLVGASRGSERDPFVAPVSDGVTSGVYYHATAVENLLRHGPAIKATTPHFAGWLLPPWAVFAGVFTALNLLAAWPVHRLRRAASGRVPKDDADVGGYVRLIPLLLANTVIVGALYLVGGTIFHTVFNWSATEWAGTGLFSQAFVGIMDFKASQGEENA